MGEDVLKKKVAYAGIAAALLFTGFQSTKTYAASPVTDVQKKIVEFHHDRHSTVKDSKFHSLNVRKFVNKSSGFTRLEETNNPIIESEPNDLPDYANPAELDTGIFGDFRYNVNVEGDLDFFKINITEPGYLVLMGSIVENNDYLGELGFALLDPLTDKFVIPEDYGTDEGIDYQILSVTPGTYYIGATNLNKVASNDIYMLYAGMIDTTPPAQPIVNPIDDNDKTISGKAEAGSTVTIKNGVATFKTIKADKYSNFKVSLAAPFKAGTKLSFTAEDSAGNVSPVRNVTVLDKTPPDAPKVNPFDDNDKYITGKAEAYSKITIKNGTKPFGVANTDKYGNFKFPTKPVKAGSKLDFTATDRFKNVSSTTSVTVADKTAPATLTVNKVKKTSKYVSGKTEAIAYVKVKAGSKTLASGKADSKGYYKLKIKAQKKNTTLTITAKDAAGNSKVVKVKVK